jgi:hypothetical protein
MTKADQIVAGLLEDPTTQALLEGKSPETVQSVSDRWRSIITDELDATPATPVAVPTPDPTAAPAAPGTAPTAE